MMSVPSDHLAHLQRRPFVFGCSASIFPADELEALAEFGNWLQALAGGLIQPANAEQERFLRADREELEPDTLLERAWLRLKGRREYEQDQQSAGGTSRPVDYGIVEWDADRCWW
jgi:uncharacterized protein YifE (UPF0438 family)